MAQNLLVPQLRKFARNVCLVLTCPIPCFCENVGFYPNLDSSFICQLPQLHSVLSYTHFLLYIFHQYVEHQLCAKIRSVIQWRGDILFTLILDRGGNDRGLAPSGEAGTGQQAEVTLLMCVLSGYQNWSFRRLEPRFRTQSLRKQSMGTYCAAKMFLRQGSLGNSLEPGTLLDQGYMHTYFLIIIIDSVA